MNKPSYSLFVVLAASLLLSLLYIPAFNPLSGDKEIYSYVARVMLKGGAPYRDVFDHKPPLIYFLNYASLLLGSWGQWLIDTVLVLLATFLFFRIGKRYSLPYPWLPPLLFNLMLRDHLICIGMGMTREYTAVFQVIFFCLLMGKHRYRYIGLGVFSGLIFFMQQEQVLPLLPFFVYALLQRKEKTPLFGPIGQAAGGFFLVALPLLLYFMWKHALSAFWQDAFVFNTAWYTTTLKESPGDHLRRVKRVLDAGNYEEPVLVTMTLGICALFFRSTDKRLILAALAAVFLSISQEFMGGRATPVDFTHYYLPLAASIPVLLFTVFAFTREPSLSGYKAQGIFAVLTCIALGYTALQHGTHLKPIANDPAVTSPEMDYLRRHRPGDYQYYQFGNNDFVYAYNEFGIIGPSPWVYQHFWQLYNHWDKDHLLLRSIAQDLLRHRTTYVLDFTTPDGWFRDPTAYAWWHAFLQENYQPVMTTVASHSILWKLKGSPE